MSWATPERILVEHGLVCVGPSDLLFKSSVEFCESLASHHFQEQSQRFICPSFAGILPVYVQKSKWSLVLPAKLSMLSFSNVPRPGNISDGTGVRSAYWHSARFF